MDWSCITRASLSLMVAGMAFAAPAARVTAEQARQAVGTWLRKGRSLDRTLGRDIVSLRTLTATNGAVFHVARLDRGFVITSGDTKMEPIVSFSRGTDLDENEANPLWTLIRKDMAIRAATAGVVPSGVRQSLRLPARAAGEKTAAEDKWAELLSEDGGTVTPEGAVREEYMALPSVSDVRVEPLVRSAWGQGKVGTKNVYNLYTPKNCVCGCVATAGAQLMRFHEWPRTSMAQYTCEYCKVNSSKTTLTTQAGLYSWANMPLSPTASITDTECQAIGRLTSDVGIACGMNYSASGSSAGGYMLSRALVENFGYSNAVAMQKSSGCTAEETRNALISNFDAGLPVVVSIDGSNIGHSVVGDGYGYSDNTLYYHFNMGWYGSEDVWYAPPDLATEQYAFNAVDGFVYNVYTNQTKDAVIVSGRVLTSDGDPIANVPVAAKRNGTAVATMATNDRGIYAFVLPAGDYSVVATHSGSTVARPVSLSACVSLNLCTGKDFGFYWPNPEPVVGNQCDRDVVINGLDIVAEPQFSPMSADGLFYPSTNVTLSCPTAGAVIRYTLDGSEPTETSPVYGCPIFVDDTVTIKARAFKSGLNPSAMVAMTYVYDVSQGSPKGDLFANPISISGTNGTRTVDNFDLYSVETGEPNHTLTNNTQSHQYKTVWFRWTAPGSGTMTFRTSCTGVQCMYANAVAVYEGTTYSDLVRKGMAKYNKNDGYVSTLSVAVEQYKNYRIVGVGLSSNIVSGAVMTLSWSGKLTEEVRETPVTAEVPIPVRHDWLVARYPSAAASSYAELVKTVGANGRPVWVSYLLGLEPTSADSDLKITSFAFENGVPVFTCNVDAARVDGFGYSCKVKGKTGIGDRDWVEKTDGQRFFRIFVEPKGNP